MMTLVSVDTTPNPNSMKYNLSEPLGMTATFTAENAAAAPPFVQELLAIQGVNSVFCTASFVTLNRDPRTDWPAIMDAARRVFESKRNSATAIEDQRDAVEKQGQVEVLVQTFRDIPIQVKVTDGINEERIGLPERFGEAARELQTHFGGDYLKERHWAEWGVRYGSLEEVAREVAEEIEARMDEDRLNQRKRQAMGKTTEATPKVDSEPENLNPGSSDWYERFLAVQQLEATDKNLPLFIQALHDEKPQIRRWTAARLAGVKTPESVEALSDALLNDSNVGVRRTAGDSLSDIGDVSAQGAVCQALKDKNKLVRWRAARFLAEVGTKEALPALEQAKDDPEYEVRLEVEAAIHYIREGFDAPLPVWKLMSQDR